MANILGQSVRFRMNTGTTQSPTWKTILNETSVTLSPTSDKVEITNKDTGKHKSYLKTLIDHTLSITAQENLSPGANDLTFADIYGFFLLNHTDTNNGIYEMELYSTKSGVETLAFTGFIETCSTPFENNGVVSYTFTVQVVSLPTHATVA